MTSPSTTMGSSSSGSPSSVMSAKCRVRPSRTASVKFGSSEVTISIPSASSLVAGLTWVRLHLCKQFRMCTQTVSFRPGFGSSLGTHTPAPHHPWAPSFRLCMKTGSPATSARCGFRRRPWAAVVIALRSAATTHPWAAAIRIASLRRISLLASCAIVQGSMKSVSSKFEGSRSCRPKKSLAGRESGAPHTSIELCKREVDQLICFVLRSRGFQAACFLEGHLGQGSVSLDDRILAWRFQIRHHRQNTPGLTQLLKVGTKFGARVQNRHNVAKVSVAVAGLGVP